MTLVAKYFIKNYHLRISQGHIHNSEELVRFFLKLIKTSANNINKSLEIVERKNGEEYEFISEGKANTAPKTNIFNEVTFPNLNFPKHSAEQKIKTKSQKLNLRNIIIYISIGLVVGLVVGLIL